MRTMNKILHTIMFLAISAFPLYAQENRITPPAEDEVVVGAIGGNVDISALGGATYSIPIQVPDGIDGMQPNLSIVYNSQSGNGLLGWGWNLGGLSAITRTGHTNYHDGYVDGVDFDGDNFVLDGQRLMVLNGATYGSNNAEYKTEVDGMSKIVSYTGNGINGPKSFKVWTADGLIMEYGNDENARIVYQNGVNRDVVVIWLLNRIENREGNYVVYNYDNQEHRYRINNIQYSGHPGSKTTVYGINFHYYENRVDRECIAIGNHILYEPWLLKDISIYHWSQPLSKYEFVYDENSGQLNSHYYYNRLKEIHYEYEGVAVNPTEIEWGEYPSVSNQSYPNVNDINISTINYQMNFTHGLQDYVKFVGDLNGDGLQDYICVGRAHTANDKNDSIVADTNERTRAVRTAYVLLNKGHTKTDNNSGQAYFEEIGKFDVSFDLRWIYVADFDGDGIDELLFVGDSYDDSNNVYIVKYEFMKLKDNATLSLSKDGVIRDNSRYANYSPAVGSTFSFESFGYGVTGTHFHLNENRNYSFVVGDFMGRGRCDVIFTYPYQHFLYFTYDVQNQYMSVEESVTDWNAMEYTVGDFDGDGKTEVWFDSPFDNENGIMAKIYINNQGNYTWYSVATLMDSWNRNFVGDFNGDGHDDFLTYRKDSHSWTILLFKQNWHSYPVYIVTNDMASYLGESDPGDANYSIYGKEELSTFIQIADMDGDGKSDVVLRNDSTLAVLFGPPTTYGFSRVEDFVSNDIGIRGESACGLCVGNFLGQENAAIISNERMYSLPQYSIYNNVISITDGMGNQAAFEYDYLIHNPKKVQGTNDNNIYTLTEIGTNLSYNIYNTPLPVKAVSLLATTNANLETGAISIDSCSYENALVHRQGKGLLGFQKTVRDNWLIPKESKSNATAKHQAKTVNSYNFKIMGEHCMNLLENEDVFRYKKSMVSPNEYEEILVSRTGHDYQKFLCSRDYNLLGIKVFMPLENIMVTDNYELLGERSLLRRRIAKSVYNGLNNANSYLYANTVHATETWQGTDANQQLSVEDCEFQNHTTVSYENDLTNNWIINRPQMIQKETTRLTEGFATEKSTTRYVYHSQKPYLPQTMYYYPSWTMSSSEKLAYNVEYVYVDGRVQTETLSSTYDTLNPRSTVYEYDPYYRFKTKVTNSYGHETSYQYDDVYGNLISITDCNGYQTVIQNDDHLGITKRTYNANNDTNHTQINGTESVTALRWLEGSAYEQYAPNFGDPAYFSWTKSESSAETFTIFDATGRELRTVSRGLRDTGSNIIYKDTKYDVWGRVEQKSDPYFSDTQSNSIKWTTYEYDDFDRITKINLPSYELNNETVQPYVSNVYDGLVTTTESGALVGQNQEKKVHTTSTAVNVMGWTDYNKEFLDPYLTTFNITTYGYNANGSLAWTKVNEDENTKVSMLYDNAGNRIELHDPDYGTTLTHYDAFGQLQWQDTPKGDHTAYYYDNIGRLVIRTETDNSGGTPVTDTTIWRFSGTDGTLGLLDSIKLNHRQKITYTYDPLYYNNLMEITEEHSNSDYSTFYLYGDSNFPQRVSTVTYPSGYTIGKFYDAITGKLTEIRHNNQLLWKTHDANALGQITDFEMGNGVHSYYQYDDCHHLSAQQASKNGNTIQNFGYVYDVFGNLEARTEDKFLMPNTETFIYDYLNRLKSITLNETVSSGMNYDAFGRILSKEADGQTVFSDAQYNIYDQFNHLKPHAISSATTTNNSLFSPILQMSYTMFDKVKTLTQYDNNSNPINTIGYTYGYDHERIVMEKGTNYEKQYWGNCELITQNGNATHWNTFISGPLGVFAVVTSTNNTDVLRYVYKDHLGSWTTITDDAGTVLQELSFDAWGNLRAAGSWSGLYNGVLLYDRGFTGHEHLFDFGLINMNGRMYDPVMSSFLSVDSYIQSPDFSQSFNRYAYCLNNPLVYVDPTGEKWWHWALADVLSGGFLSSTALVTAEFAFTTVATSGMTAYAMQFPFTETGYEIQKSISPVAIKLSYGFGSTNHLGVDVSLGLSGAPSYRWHCGASYYFGGNIYGNYNGWETRSGAEFRVLPLVSISGTKFRADEFSQTTNKITIGDAHTNISYENDFMWGFDAVLGRCYKADNGDRFRTAAARIKAGPFSVGINLFTGDPGRIGGEGGDRNTEMIDNHNTYVLGNNGENPDKYRAGVFYVGLGSIKLGWNSEGIRNCFQNELIHEPCGYPYFKVLDIRPQFYFYYGNSTGNTLW